MGQPSLRSCDAFSLQIHPLEDATPEMGHVYGLNYAMHSFSCLSFLFGLLCTSPTMQHKCVTLVAALGS